jgi:hypothetical protein
MGALAMSMVEIWARLAYGCGIVAEGMLLAQHPPLEESIAAFWRPWNKRS